MTNKTEPTVTISIRDYEELKKFKDNFHLKNFVSTKSKDNLLGCDFYSDTAMNKRLMEQIENLKSEINDLVAEKKSLENKGFSIKEDYKDSLFKLQTELESVRKLNILGFLKWKNSK